MMSQRRIWMNDEEDDTHTLIEFNMRIHGKRERERDRPSVRGEWRNGWMENNPRFSVCCLWEGGVLVTNVCQQFSNKCSHVVLQKSSMYSTLIFLNTRLSHPQTWSCWLQSLAEFRVNAFFSFFLSFAFLFLFCLDEHLGHFVSPTRLPWYPPLCDSSISIYLFSRLILGHTDE